MEKNKKERPIFISGGKNKYKRVLTKTCIKRHIKALGYTSPSLCVNLTEDLMGRMTMAKLRELKKGHNSRIPIKVPPGSRLNVKKANVVSLGYKRKKGKKYGNGK